MTRAQSRKHRGYKTQRLLAERWRDIGLFPYATARGAGEQGSDVFHTPGLAVEVKARDTVSLPHALLQAATGAEEGWELPIVVTRVNGQGESPASMDKWPISMNLEDFERLWRITVRLATEKVENQDA